MTTTKARPAKPEAIRDDQACVNCGGKVFYTVSVSLGSRWVHWVSGNVTCPKATR